MKPKPVSKRRFYRLWFDNFNSLVEQGLTKLSRSELAAYLILLHNTRPNGTARVSLTEIVRQGKMSESSASRAIRSLIKRGSLRIVRRGVPGRSTLYTLFKPEVLEELNPGAAKWVRDGIEVGQESDGSHE